MPWLASTWTKSRRISTKEEIRTPESVQRHTIWYLFVGYRVYAEASKLCNGIRYLFIYKGVSWTSLSVCHRLQIHYLKFGSVDLRKIDDLHQELLSISNAEAFHWTLLSACNSLYTCQYGVFLSIFVETHDRLSLGEQILASTLKCTGLRCKAAWQYSRFVYFTVIVWSLWRKASNSFEETFWTRMLHRFIPQLITISRQGQRHHPRQFQTDNKNNHLYHLHQA